MINVNDIVRTKNTFCHTPHCTKKDRCSIRKGINVIITEIDKYRSYPYFVRTLDKKESCRGLAEDLTTGYCSIFEEILNG